MQRISQIAIAALCLTAGAAHAQFLGSGAAALLDGYNAAQNPRGVQPPQFYQPPPAYEPPGVTAYFTGQTQSVELISGGPGMACQYEANGRTFWRAFRGNCPSSLRVQ